MTLFAPLMLLFVASVTLSPSKAQPIEKVDAPGSNTETKEGQIENQEEEDVLAPAVGPLWPFFAGLFMAQPNSLERVAGALHILLHGP